MESVNNLFQYPNSFSTSQKSKLTSSHKRTSPLGMMTGMQRELTSSVKNQY